MEIQDVSEIDHDIPLTPWRRALIIFILLLSSSSTIIICISCVVPSVLHTDLKSKQRQQAASVSSEIVGNRHTESNMCTNPCGTDLLPALPL